MRCSIHAAGQGGTTTTSRCIITRYQFSQSYPRLATTTTLQPYHYDPVSTVRPTLGDVVLRGEDVRAAAYIPSVKAALSAYRRNGGTTCLPCLLYIDRVHDRIVVCLMSCVENSRYWCVAAWRQCSVVSVSLCGATPCHALAVYCTRSVLSGVQRRVATLHSCHAWRRSCAATVPTGSWHSMRCGRLLTCSRQ
jgi:hypothetical protein